MDTIANFLNSLHNAELAHHLSVTVPTSKVNRAIAGILQENGYLTSVSEEEKKLQVTLPQPVTVHRYKRLSKPGRRLYANAKNIPVVMQGLGLVILSTPQGVMSGKEAKQKGIGGELICQVY